MGNIRVFRVIRGECIEKPCSLILDRMAISPTDRRHKILKIPSILSKSSAACLAIPRCGIGVPPFPTRGFTGRSGG